MVIVMAKKKKKKVTKKRYRLKWKNLLRFILIIALVVLLIEGIIKLVDIYTDFTNIDSIANKSQSLKKENLVDDNTTTIVKPNIELSKFDEYYNYVKLGMLNVDLNSLKKINPDIVGYVEVKGTNISYPVVHGSSNYYLNHSVDKSKNVNGALYTEISDFSEIANNTIIYGKVDYFGKLFGSLNTLFKDSWQDNGNNYVIKFYNGNYTSIWEIVSIYRSKSINNYDDILNKSEYDFNTTLSDDDKILTLVGLKNNKNIIVHAKLIKYKKIS